MHRPKTIFCWIFIRSCSNIPILIPVALFIPINARDQHIMPNIKLPLIVEHRPINILLHNVGLPIPIFMLLLMFNNSLDLIESLTNRNSISSVAELTRLNNPYIPNFLSFIVLIFFWKFIFFIKIVQEFQVLGVFYAMLYMKSKGQILKHIFIHGFIIFLHCWEKGLFVTKHIVPGKMIVYFKLVEIRDLFTFLKEFVSSTKTRIQFLLILSIFLIIFAPDIQFMGI